MSRPPRDIPFLTRAGPPTDIVEAAVEAYINAVNRHLALQNAK